MVKTKRIYALCKLCNKQISIEVPADMAKDRDYYPFEYIEIHGEPEHALMIFLDQNLAVRDSIAYSDLRIVKTKGTEYKNLVRMSEIDSLASIYTNPIRLKLFQLLTTSPYTEEDLINKLKESNVFIEEEFHMIMLPLIRTGLIKTKWLQDTFQMGYFLIKDFVVLRIPAKITSLFFKKDERFRGYQSAYFNRVNETLTEFKRNFLLNRESRIQETIKCLKFRSELKYLSVYNLLWTEPLPADDLVEKTTKDVIEQLINWGFIDLIQTKTESYYTLLSDISINKFKPKYMVNLITNQFQSNNITKEIALYHLDYLFEEN